MGFSKIERDTRNDERFREWTRLRRDVWLYLLCNPHQDRQGCRLGAYVLDPAWIAPDLAAPDWQPTVQEIVREMTALHHEERIVWDPRARVVLLCNFFRHSPPENPNVAKAAAADVGTLPASVTVLEGLLEAVRKHLPPTFPKGGECGKVIERAIVTRLEAARASGLQRNELNKPARVTQTVSQTSPEPFTEPYREPAPNPEPEPEPIPEPEPVVVVTEIPPSSPARARGETAASAPNGRLITTTAAGVAEPTTPALDADREVAISAAIRAANTGMARNEHLPEPSKRPILTTHGKSRQQVADWLDAGIPLQVILDVVHARALAYKPDQPNDRIHSLAYFDRGVREAHETGRSSAWRPPGGSEAADWTEDREQRHYTDHEADARRRTGSLEQEEFGAVRQWIREHREEARQMLEEITEQLRGQHADRTLDADELEAMAFATLRRRVAETKLPRKVVA